MDNNLPLTAHLSSDWLGIFILLGVILLVAGGLFIWAMYFRKVKTRKRKYRKSYREKLGQGAREIKAFVNEHSRRSKHERYRRNRTLAETGGLPPRRPPDGQKKPDAT